MKTFESVKSISRRQTGSYFVNRIKDGSFIWRYLSR